MESGQTPPPREGPGAEAPQSEEELRARLEEEMRRVSVQDLVLQSVASIVNLTARRIAKEDERDLEQARIGIEAARGLVGLLEPEPQKQVREALSELQLLYAQASGTAAPGEGREGEQPQERAKPEEPAQPQQRQQPSRGPERRGSGLWTPPGT